MLLNIHDNKHNVKDTCYKDISHELKKLKKVSREKLI